MIRSAAVQALILAGGSGTRFWPASRRSRPKQLLALEGDRSLLRATVDRLRPLIDPRDVWVCTTRQLAGPVRQELPDVPAEQVLAEPVGRNTAPAIGWSTRSILDRRGEQVVAVLPADHRVGDAEAFRHTLAAAARAAEEGKRILTLGVQPRWAESGYGYLEIGETLDPESGLARVVRFTEKPDPETARRFFDSGRYLWNAGIFVFPAAVALRRMAQQLPELGRGLDAIADDPESLERVYPTLPSVSIDHGVMEHLDDLATLPLACEWSDLGSWTALAEVLAADAEGNVRQGDVVAVDAEDNLLIASEGTVAALGVSGLAVVRTADAVLVIPKERAQEVRRIVAELRRRGREELL